MTVGLCADGIRGMGPLRPPQAVADDGDAAPPEERHPVRAVAPAAGFPAEFWVFFLQRAPWAVPGIGVYVPKGALRDVGTEVVHSPSPDRVDLEEDQTPGAIGASRDWSGP